MHIIDMFYNIIKANTNASIMSRNLCTFYINHLNWMSLRQWSLRVTTFVLFYYDLRVAFTSIQFLPFAYSNEEFAFGQRFIAAFCKWQVKLIYGTYTTLWNISHYFNASNIIISAFLHQI